MVAEKGFINHKCLYVTNKGNRTSKFSIPKLQIFQPIH